MTLMRRPLSYDLTEEDRLTVVRWTRGMGIFYGCIVLLLLGAIALVKPSSVALSGVSDRQISRAGLPGESAIAMPTVPRKAQ